MSYYLRKLVFLVCLLITISISSQTVSTVIKTDIYTSYFSYQTHTPLFVVYKLYHGGGTFSRKGLSFSEAGQVNSSTKSDYDHSGYDIGHMCNAEDFAYNDNFEKQTFRFYNALPQKPALNRGIWEIYETNIRQQSKTDSILVICGGYQFVKKIGNTSVPSYCFKYSKNLRTKEEHYYIFPNDTSDTVTEVSKQTFLLSVTYNDLTKLL